MFYISGISVRTSSYSCSNIMWLEVRLRLVKKRLWVTKTIVTSFSYVGLKHDNLSRDHS